MEDVGVFWLAWPSYERRSSSTWATMMPGSVGYDRAVMVAMFEEDAFGSQRDWIFHKFHTILD